MTPYRDRRDAGHYDDPDAAKKTPAEKATTTENLGGLTGKAKPAPTITKAKRGL